MTIRRPRVMAVRAYRHAALVCAPARPNRGPGPRRHRWPLPPERLRDERGEGEEEPCRPGELVVGWCAVLVR